MEEALTNGAGSVTVNDEETLTNGAGSVTVNDGGGIENRKTRKDVNVNVWHFVNTAVSWLNDRTQYKSTATKRSFTKGTISPSPPQPNLNFVCFNELYIPVNAQQRFLKQSSS